MKKNYKTEFLKRQYMLSRDYEIYYYSDSHLAMWTAIYINIMKCIFSWKQCVYSDSR